MRGISLDGYSSKIRKVKKFRSTVSNKTILGTKEEFFFAKVAPVKKHKWHFTLRFWLILLPWMLILSYINIYFLVNIVFFECLYFSEYDIRMFLFAFWLRNRPFITYLRNRGNGGMSSKMCTGMYNGREVSRLICTYTLTLSLFIFSLYSVVYCQK